MDVKKLLLHKGEELLNEFENMTAEADQVQESILTEILRRNGSTEYLNKYLKGSTDISAFKSLVPVITYPDIAPYIKRIANGEASSLISGHPITELIRSTGTSGGEPKIAPLIAEDNYRHLYLLSLITSTTNLHVPGLDRGKAMYMYFVKADIPTPSGIPIRSLSASFYKYAKKYTPGSSFNSSTSPDEAIICPDVEQSMYCQLLSGLIHRHQVLRMGAAFASAFLGVITFFKHNWADLCNDIRSGQVNSRITDAGCRAAIVDILKCSDPQSADEIEKICSSKLWKGIICKLWPKAKYIEGIMTGTMSQYIPALEFYTGGKLPLVSVPYASSECGFGINLNPLCNPSDVVYTLVPNMGYFEFIPLGDNGLALKDEDGIKPVDMGHVTPGSYYEIVVTTFAGLNRYRIGDIVQVHGFHNRSPQVRFICRRNVVLSIDFDKTSEDDLHKSVTLAKRMLDPYNAFLVDYTSYSDTSTVPGHYVLFWEIQHHGEVEPFKVDKLEDCCIAMEEALDYEYRRCRNIDKSVGPLEIRVVCPGTFEALMNHFTVKGATINQYKTPRCIKTSDALELLNSSVDACFFSPRNPAFSPYSLVGTPTSEEATMSSQPS